VQVEVSGVGGDAVDQLIFQSTSFRFEKGKWSRKNRKDERGRKKEEEGKETHERILKVLVCPKPPFHP
jgi:hypothetical protein